MADEFLNVSIVVGTPGLLAMNVVERHVNLSLFPGERNRELLKESASDGAGDGAGDDAGSGSGCGSGGSGASGGLFAQRAKRGGAEGKRGGEGDSTDSMSEPEYFRIFSQHHLTHLNSTLCYYPFNGGGTAAAWIAPATAGTMERDPIGSHRPVAITSMTERPPGAKDSASRELSIGLSSNGRFPTPTLRTHLDPLAVVVRFSTGQTPQSKQILFVALAVWAGTPLQAIVDIATSVPDVRVVGSATSESRWMPRIPTATGS